ncbi:amino acid ABC transporter permease [Microvirga sp. M2]|uniref:amino acid ABC transporter permease n=1 Tax=Microvirga sp. M2 TaxID=3073270 RepID=UPI0039C2B145
MGFDLKFAFLLTTWPEFLLGAFGTIQLTAITFLIALPSATALAVIKMTTPGWVRWGINIYVELIRNTPILVQLFFIFFGLPALGIRLSPNTTAVIGLSLYSTAYLVEVIRSGLLSVPKGQIEAARALGLGPIDVFRDVIFVPALRVVFPAITSQFVMILLTTSVASAISANELTHTTNFIQSVTFLSFEAYIVSAALYFLSGSIFLGLFAIVNRMIFSYPMAK